MSVPVVFVEAKHPNRTLAPHRGAGTVDRTGDTLVLEGTRPRKVLNFLLGGAGFLVGVVAAAIGAVVLEELGLDLLAYRKGGGLIAMVALFLGVVLGGGLIRLGELVIGHASVRVAVPTSALTGIGAEGDKVAAVWTQGPKTFWVVMVAPDGETAPVMALLRSTRSASP